MGKSQLVTGQTKHLTELETVQNVGPDGVTWNDVMPVMNGALSETKYEYSYKENDNSTTKETMPLIIIKLPTDFKR